MDPLISVIVPVYRVEEYLDKCINSIVSQSYRNLEIILIDDGSPDRCGAICDAWAGRDPRIKVLHKENSGLSDTRNMGLEMARGELITFVDSDDYTAPDMIGRLYQMIKDHSADISICGRYLVYENGRVTVKDKKNAAFVMDSEAAIRNMCALVYYDVASWGKLYRSSLFEHIRFPVGKLSEDWYVTYRLLDRADTVAYDSTPLYYYFQRNNSLSRSEKVNDAPVDASREFINFVKEKYPKLVKEASTSFVSENMAVYNSYIMKGKKCDTALLRQLKRNVLSNLGKILKNRSISLFKKVQVMIFCLNSQLYKYAYRHSIHILKG